MELNKVILVEEVDKDCVYAEHYGTGVMAYIPDVEYFFAMCNVCHELQTSLD